MGVIERRVIPIERLVDRALSMSTTSPEQLGSLTDRLARELLKHMRQFASAGTVIEIIESQALIARRGETGMISGLRTPAPFCARQQHLRHSKNWLALRTWTCVLRTLLP
jgi:hypothetical protein